MKSDMMTLLAFCMTSFYFFSCSSPANQTTATYDIGLVETKKITLPVDESTYYMTKCIYHFEEDGKEYLHFQNTEKRQYEIIIYDLESLSVTRKIPLEKQGPNAIPAIFGSKPWGDSKKFLFFQNSASRVTIGDANGKVIRKYRIQAPNDGFIAFFSASYFFTPSFIKDSVIYISPDVNPRMKKDDWIKTSMFFSLDLRSGDINFLPIHYPSVFNQDIECVGGGETFTYDYNYTNDRLVCSFTGYDSLMVTDDLRNVKWVDGKSRYLKSLRPEVGESSAGLQWLKEYNERAKYSHVMYDKYRDVYYRFAEHPCELGDDEYPMDNPKAREFSVIIFDKDFNIIGETKFPGNKYLYKMVFVGRDGLYISENNLANPDFDEDKLVFACFKLEDVKE